MLESTPAALPGALLFVDVDTRDPQHISDSFVQLRRLSASGLGNVGTVVVRWPGTSAPDDAEAVAALEDLDRQLGELRVAAATGVASANIGDSHSIRWSAVDSDRRSGSASDREVELASLIGNGRALWQPEQYHYRLPSGRHSGSFVRLADAVRTIRDADVLAWWLLGDVAEATGVVIDTSTIVPIVLALRSQCAAAGIQIGGMQSLHSYPATLPEFTKAIREVSVSNAPVLALLSVSSTGTLRQRLATALRSMVDDHWRMHVFVDKLGTGATDFDGSLGDLVGNSCTWFCPEVVDFRRNESSAESCSLCKSDKRSRVVQIDPRSFDGLVLPDPELVMPDIRFAERSRDFWRICDDADALALDVEPHPSSAPFRPHRFTMGVRVDFDPLLTSADVENTVGPNGPADSTDASAESSPLQDAVSDYLRGCTENDPAMFLTQAQLFVGIASEFQRAEGAGEHFFRSVLEAVAPGVDVCSVAADVERIPDDISAQIVERERICIVSLGVVTGASLHSILACIQHVRRQAHRPAAEVGALTVHLRPPSHRERETIVNPFGSGRFLAVYESLLPYGRSPIKDEQDYLNSLSHWPEIEASEYYRARLDYLREGLLDARENMGIFWAMDKDDPVVMRPGSWYGESLSGLASLVAVGSAVQRRRHTQASPGTVPEWRQFEIPSIFRSYYDPFILASLIRWLQPEECWWGRDVNSSAQIVQELLNGYNSEADRRLIVGELLLAAALGKVPTPAIAVLRDSASAMVNSVSSESASSALKLGLAILDREYAEPSV
ncbi:hypothetical protein [Candidatus Poriferisodalis sp.]|uniref:hypothetical protein n=1 Tax=Candidatus Poriferisodalis sp. TaxID=3101277 RepID=UPI003B020679